MTGCREAITRLSVNSESLSLSQSPIDIQGNENIFLLPKLIIKGNNNIKQKVFQLIVSTGSSRLVVLMATQVVSYGRDGNVWLYDRMGYMFDTDSVETGVLTRSLSLSPAQRIAQRPKARDQTMVKISGRLTWDDSLKKLENHQGPADDSHGNVHQFNQRIEALRIHHVHCASVMTSNYLSCNHRDWSTRGEPTAAADDETSWRRRRLITPLVTIFESSFVFHRLIPWWKFSSKGG